MNWPSFTAGLVIAAAAIAGLFVTAPQVPPVWRQCAPAQDGERLVSTVQHHDRTECFYARGVLKGVVPRKAVIS